MRLDTEYWIGIRHVGVKGSEDIVELLPVRDAIQRLIKFLASVTLAQRIDFVMARTEDEVRNRLNSKANAGIGSRSGTKYDSMADDFERMMNELEGND